MVLTVCEMRRETAWVDAEAKNNSVHERKAYAWYLDTVPHKLIACHCLPYSVGGAQIDFVEENCISKINFIMYELQLS